MVVRKNASTLTATEKAEFVSAVHAIKTLGKYEQYVLTHAQATMSAIHSCPAFLAWHRSFILDYEKDLQTASGNPNLALPYWNWGENAALADPANSPVWADDFMGGDGDPADNFIVKTGPFRQGEWVVVDGSGNPGGPLIREFGRTPGAPTLSSQADIDNALATAPYDALPWNRQSNPSFRNRLEGWYGAAGPGLHNRGHVWVGGSMLPMTSPNDPIFFLHHCFVDKLWADWQEGRPLSEQYLPDSGGSPKQNLNDQMEPTVSGTVSPKDMLDITALGYSYDTDPVGGTSNVPDTAVGEDSGISASDAPDTAVGEDSGISASDVPDTAVREDSGTDSSNAAETPKQQESKDGAKQEKGYKD